MGSIGGMTWIRTSFPVTYLGKSIPSGVFCAAGAGRSHSRWTVVVSPEADFRIHIVHTIEVARVHDAWNFLLDVGKAMAETHDVKPEELILSERRPVIVTPDSLTSLSSLQ